MIAVSNIGLTILFAATAGIVAIGCAWRSFMQDAMASRTREHDARYRALSDLTTEGVSIHENGVIVEANQAFADMYGYTVPELIGRPVMELTAPEFRATVAEQMARNLPGTYESVSFRKDGSRIPIEIKSMPTTYLGRPMRVSRLRELTEEKAAEKAIRDREAQLRLVTDAVPALIVYLDSELRYQYVNRIAEIWHDRPASELIGKHVWDQVDKATFEAAKRQYDNARDGNPRFFEDTFTYSDGKTRDVSASYVPHLDEDGTLLGYYALVQDITDRKQAERAMAAGQEELRQREQTLRQILETSPVPLVITRKSDAAVLFANQAYASVLGANLDDFVHQSGADVYLDPQDRVQLLRELEANGQTNRETQLRKSDGSVITIFGSIRTIDFEGEDAILSGFQDVTERRQAEDQLKTSETRFRDFAASASDWYWEMDENLVYTYVSPNVRELLDQPASDFIGNSHRDILARRFDQSEWQPFFEAVRKRRPYRNLVIRRQEDDGSESWISSTGLPIFSEDGEFKGYRGTATNITALKEAEANLLQAQKMEAIGQLTGGIAHDFNNLLAIMTGNMALLEEDLGPDHRFAELTRPTMRAINQATSLISRMLAFSRRQPLAAKPVDVNDLLGDMQPLLRRTLGDDIQVVITPEPGLIPCFADPAQLEQAILNLAINARDAMPEGGCLTFATSQVQVPGDQIQGGHGLAPGQYVEIAISDNGLGISPSDQLKIFEPFFTTKDVGKGTGLGLSMVYGFVTQSEGHIGVNSELGVGTTFRIFLPRATDEPTVEASGPSASPVQPQAGKTILVVEDEPEAKRPSPRSGKKIWP
ncbi:MAG: PAS domain S-box protein [Alphaproteobacteria bacterium]|jgi:PAS domain S-box-containing protein|nr:PAS domain S-box protein [Alphaproteobacteria bacterium]